MNLAALGVHHHGHREPLLLIKPPDLADDPAVPVVGAVAHVDPRHVHPANGEGLQLLRGAGGGADRAHQLRPSGAPEPVLLELRFGDGVHVDGGGGRPAGIAVEGEEVEIRVRRRGGGAEGVAAGTGEAGKGAGWEGERRQFGERGGGRGRREEAESLSHLFCPPCTLR